MFIVDVFLVWIILLSTIFHATFVYIIKPYKFPLVPYIICILLSIFDVDNSIQFIALLSFSYVITLYEYGELHTGNMDKYLYSFCITIFCIKAILSIGCLLCMICEHFWIN